MNKINLRNAQIQTKTNLPGEIIIVWRCPKIALVCKIGVSKPIIWDQCDLEICILITRTSQYVAVFEKLWNIWRETLVKVVENMDFRKTESFPGTQAGS